MFKDKITAFLIHFAISAVLMLIAGFITFYLWYAAPYFQLFDVKPIFLMMLGIDLILGTLLTFIVYKKNKSTLKMDLAIIAAIQLAAFGWGMWNIANARPAWIAIYKDTAYTISPAFLKNPDNNLKVVVPSVFEQNWGKPKLVMLPNNDNTPNIIYHTDKYLPLDSKMMVANQLPLSQIATADKALFTMVKTTYPTAVGYFPVITEASSDLPLILIDLDGKPISTVVAYSKVKAPSVNPKNN